MGTSGVPQRILRQIVYSGKDEPTPGDHLWRSWVDKLTTFRGLGPESSFLVDVVVHDVGEHVVVLNLLEQDAGAAEDADVIDDAVAARDLGSNGGRHRRTVSGAMSRTG
jgi:hypothetical protein